VSAQAFVDGFGPAVTVAAGLALIGAIAGSLLPGHGQEAELVSASATVPALEAEGA
jgi:hypothetical protein